MGLSVETCEGDTSETNLFSDGNKKLMGSRRV